MDEDEEREFTPRRNPVHETDYPTPGAPDEFDVTVDIDTIIQNTPTIIIRLLRPIINNLEIAQLHVQDGLQDGEKHHFESAQEAVGTVRRNLIAALSHVDTYLVQIGSYLGEPATPVMNCEVCGGVATLREVGGNGKYFCSKKCQNKEYGL